MSEFTSLLQQYRRNSTDPERGGLLTQGRLAELLQVETGLIFSSQQISYWETGRRPIPIDNRELLLGIIKVLTQCGGIEPLPDANQLLISLGLRELDSAEIRQIIGLSESIQTPEEKNTIAGSVPAWLDEFFNLSSASEHVRSSWEGLAIYMVDTTMAKIGWLGILKLFLLIGAMWLAVTQIVPALRVTELADPDVRLNVVIRYALGLVTVPILLAIVTPEPASLKVNNFREKRTLFVLQLTGSYIGFTVITVLLFFVSILDALIPQIPFPYWFYASLFALPMFFAYLFARRHPVNHYKISGDMLILPSINIVFLLLMPLVAVVMAFLLYHGYDYFNHPAMALALGVSLVVIAYWETVGKQKSPQLQLLIVILMAIALMIFVGVMAYIITGRETGQWQLLPDEMWMLLGVLLYLAGMFVVFACTSLWHSPTFTLRGVLLFSTMVIVPIGGFAYSPLELSVRVGLCAVVLLVWTAWGRRRFRAYWWIPPSLSLGYIALFVAFTLTLLRTFHPLIIMVVYIAVVSGVVYWTYISAEPPPTNQSDSDHDTHYQQTRR